MRASPQHADAIVVGGGVIGLSVAYELAGAGLKVTLLERGELGRESSWAGAGVLPPGSWYDEHAELEELALAAGPLHERLSAELLNATGIDDEYLRCGAVYQETAENAGYLRRTLSRWDKLGIEVVPEEGDPRVWRVPTEAQVRNPRRIRALAAACRKRGVTLLEQQGFARLHTDPSGRVHGVTSAAGGHFAEHYCLCAGAWSPELADQIGVAVPGRPVRGQMLALKPAASTLSAIVHRYPYYAVPRRDGVVLVGATVEEIGFDKTTTTDAREELLRAAAAIDPSLAGARVLSHWSGLRPASADGLPVIGRAPDFENLLIATGHHRSGLQLAPVTATILGCLVRGEPCQYPVGPWDPGRFAGCCAV